MKWPILFLLKMVASLCVLTAYSQDTRGVRVTKEQYVTTTGTTYALIVGISNYPSLPPLSYADRDALLFKEFLLSKTGGNVMEENIKTFINEEAKGYSLVVEGLNWIENLPFKKGDRLYIYLAGHGDANKYNEYFFLGYDCTVGNKGAKNNYLAGSTLQIINLKDRIGSIVKDQLVEVFLIIDACRSNELPGGAEGLKTFSTAIKANTNNGETMMYASDAGQYAIEDKSIGGGHGLFTWYLVDGISGSADRNKDGKITFEELQSYVTSKVTDHNPNQTPFFFKNTTKTIAFVDSVSYVAWQEKISKINTVSSISIAKNTESDGRDASNNNLDTALIHMYNRFTKALKKNKLIGDSSASYYYNCMVSAFPNTKLTNSARYSLAAEYLNYAQGKINIYLEGKDRPDIVSYNFLECLGENGKNDESFKFDLIATIPYYQAAILMDTAMALLKADKPLTESLKTKYLFLKAQSYFDIPARISYEDALTDIKNAIKRSPESAYLFNVLGKLYKEKKDFYRAENSFLKAIKLAPTWQYPIINIGNLYLENNEFEKAIHMFRSLYSLDSSSYNCSLLADSYCKCNKFDSSEKYFIEEYRKLGHKESISELYSEMASECMYNKKYEQSIRYYLKVLAIDSTNCFALYELSCIYSIKGDRNKAIEYLESSLKKGFHSLESIKKDVDLSNIHALPKFTNLLVKYFPEEYDSSSAVYFIKKAKIFRHEKKYQEAEMNFKKALAIDRSSVTDTINLSPEVWVANIHTDYATYDSIIEKPILSTDSIGCKVSSFVLSVLPKGRDYWGPFSSSSCEMTEYQKAMLKALNIAKINSTIFIENIHLKCGEKDISSPWFKLKLIHQ